MGVGTFLDGGRGLRKQAGVVLAGWYLKKTEFIDPGFFLKK